MLQLNFFQSVLVTITVRPISQICVSSHHYSQNKICILYLQLSPITPISGLLEIVRAAGTPAVIMSFCVRLLQPNSKHLCKQAYAAVQACHGPPEKLPLATHHAAPVYRTRARSCCEAPFNCFKPLHDVGSCAPVSTTLQRLTRLLDCAVSAHAACMHKLVPKVPL